MTSSSSEQSSRITLEFNLDRPIEDAAQDVRDIVSRARGRLPQEIEEPVVSKQDADARPIIFIGLESKQYDLLQLSAGINNLPGTLTDTNESAALFYAEVSHPSPWL